MTPIDSTIPIPPPRHRYPLKQLQVGESFLVQDMTVSSMSGTVSKASRTLGRKFTLRTTNHGVRCWRIE